MTNGPDLFAVFAAHEQLTPSDEDALVHLDTALERRRRNRRAAGAASGAVAVVAAVAVGIAFAGGEGSAQHDAAGAHPASTASTPSRSTVSASTAPPVDVQGQVLDFSPAFLPAIHPRQTGYEISPSEQSRAYDMKALGTKDLYVAITVYQHMPLGGPAKRATERDIDLGGRAAHESVQAGSYQLDVDLGSGKLLTVVIQDAATADGASTVSPARLTTTGRHIAVDVDFLDQYEVFPPLALTALPSKLQITDTRLTDEVNDSIEDTQATDYTLATGKKAQDAVHISIVRGSMTPAFAPVAPGSGAVMAPGGSAQPAPGRPVQGHPSLVLHGKGAVELVVKNFAPGRELTLTGRTDTVALADLYLIADGTRWTG